MATGKGCSGDAGDGRRSPKLLKQLFYKLNTDSLPSTEAVALSKYQVLPSSPVSPCFGVPCTYSHFGDLIPQSQNTTVLIYGRKALPFHTGVTEMGTPWDGVTKRYPLSCEGVAERYSPCDYPPESPVPCWGLCSENRRDDFGFY